MPDKVKVAVAGANGYAGMTAVHLLARHPHGELVQLTSRSFAGKSYSEVFPLLDLDGEFAAEPSVDGLDVVFSCLPHNVGAAKAGAWLDAGARVIDMSADFRLHDAGQYPKWYRQEHPAASSPPATSTSRARWRSWRTPIASSMPASPSPRSCPRLPRRS